MAMPVIRAEVVGAGLASALINEIIAIGIEILSPNYKKAL